MAAPAFDTGGQDTTTGTTDITTALTIANVADRVLYCFIQDNAQAGVNSCTWNTTEALTQIASGSFATATANWYLYRLINPTAASANVVTVKTATGAMSQVAICYNGADQTTPNDAADEAEGNGTAAQNTVSSAAGDTTIAFCGADGSSTMAPASGETERVDDATGARSYELAGADTTVSFDITLGTSRAWVVVGLNLNAVAAAGVVGPLIGGRLVNNSMLVGGRLVGR